MQGIKPKYKTIDPAVRQLEVENERLNENHQQQGIGVTLYGYEMPTCPMRKKEHPAPAGTGSLHQQNCWTSFRVVHAKRKSKLAAESNTSPAPRKPCNAQK